ncbi:macro domain-containing protein [Phlyctema vagabunda]|uniref:Macro domain-containing protein n=1 Tax=Phlyctema vagabunda TaxID=108571 RepID=A0ABR4PVM5_9HELO
MLGIRRIMATVPLSEIPTLTLLYQLKQLVPSTNPALPMPSRTLNNKICVIRGDITTLEVDAIVNAANNSLLGGGGVDGAIHHAAGTGLVKECRTLDGCDTGSAKITGGYDLPCKKVIHAVGPIYSSRRKVASAADLKGCYATSLKLAVQNDCKSIAFSALSTGVYGYPSEDAARIAIQTVRDFLEEEDGEKLDKVIFCTFTKKDVDAYNDYLPLYFPSVDFEPESTASATIGMPDTDTEDEWEKIEAGQSADNGPRKKEDRNKKDTSREDTPKPDIPKDGAAKGSPVTKKEKPN